jgi:hypothetical protein
MIHFLIFCVVLVICIGVGGFLLNFIFIILAIIVTCLVTFGKAVATWFRSEG